MVIYVPLLPVQNSIKNGVILCTVENLRIDEQDCGLDFFDLTDW
jgi:hypothetical protein